MKSTNNESNNLVRYPLASAGRRFGARVLDILFITLVIFGLSLAVLATDPNFKWHELTDIQPWRYLIIGIITFTLSFGLMYLLPLLSGWSLGMKICKLRFVHILPLSKKWVNMIKHEILIWGIMCLLSLILSILLSCLTKQGYAKSLILGIQTLGISKNPSEIASMPLYYTGVGFACFYYCSALILLVVIIGLFVRNKKPTFYDKFSNMVVIHLAPTNELDKQHNKKKTANKKINYGIPGEISSGAFEELDDLE